MTAVDRIRELLGARYQESIELTSADLLELLKAIPDLGTTSPRMDMLRRELASNSAPKVTIQARDAYFLLEQASRPTRVENVQAAGVVSQTTSGNPHSPPLPGREQK